MSLNNLFVLRLAISEQAGAANEKRARLFATDRAAATMTHLLWGKYQLDEKCPESGPA